MLYLQHATDPLVWWSPDLVLRHPDWLAEPQERDGLGPVRWFPVVTLAQLTVDLLHSYSIDVESRGHRYDDLMVAA